MTNAYSTGLSFNYTSTTSSDSFGYNIKDPIIGLLECSWLNQYDFIIQPKYRLGAFLNNGFGLASLGDNSIQSTHWNGIAIVTTVKEFETNIYYLLQPGLNFQFQIIRTLWFNSIVSYRKFYGEDHFSDKSQFNSFTFSVGLSFKIRNRTI